MTNICCVPGAAVGNICVAVAVIGQMVCGHVGLAISDTVKKTLKVPVNASEGVPMSQPKVSVGALTTKIAPTSTASGTAVPGTGK